MSGERREGDGLTPATTLLPGDLRDVYTTDDGAVVLVEGVAGHRVVRLSALGEAVLQAVGSGTTLGALEVELRSRLGEPASGDLRGLVVSAVLALLDEQLIVAGQRPKDDNSGVTEP